MQGPAICQVTNVYLYQTPVFLVKTELSTCKVSMPSVKRPPAPFVAELLVNRQLLKVTSNVEANSAPARLAELLWKFSMCKVIFEGPSTAVLLRAIAPKSKCAVLSLKLLVCRVTCRHRVYVEWPEDTECLHALTPVSVSCIVETTFEK